MNLRTFIARWQELVVWLPALAAAVVLLYLTIPYLDPRSGIDGFGDLFVLAVQALKGAVITFAAWLTQRTYWRELKDDEEDALIEHARRDHPGHWKLLILDRLQFVLLLGFWAWLLA